MTEKGPTFADQAVGAVAKRQDGWLYVKVGPNAWLPLPKGGVTSFRDSLYTNDQMAYGVHHYDEHYDRVFEGYEGER